MNTAALTRSWPTLAAWGAGLLQLGVGAGMITQGTGAADRGVGVVAVAVGAAALGWGVAALTRGRLVAPRVAMAIAVAGTIASGLALAADPMRISVHAVGVTVLLHVAYGVAAAAVVRRARTAPAGSSPAEARSTPRTSVIGLVAGCVIVAGLVTPALGATEAGRNAPSHSDHPLFSTEHSH
ncbi:hypothetical protein CBF90_09240 [Microbacterium sp. AISO3]|jgi:hypothetical protein|uniref:hypothetical protein n=1 Tax=Microbacterium TaxID=33882 RepID=UPI00038FFFAF|nr:MULTISPECIES: hypothetical protein [Microbacterium]APF34057.1 hypothetical protein BO218_07535 [Microbacterium paludicola]OWP21867.1 hypothetical protein CBF90_09240 [Microbacterium sp. AISO3]GAD33846.1 hypothetical protein MTS1_01198 [Microbacterium sp. TS-1]